MGIPDAPCAKCSHYLALHHRAFSDYGKPKGLECSKCSCKDFMMEGEEEDDGPSICKDCGREREDGMDCYHPTCVSKRFTALNKKIAMLDLILGDALNELDAALKGKPHANAHSFFEHLMALYDKVDND